MNSITPLKPRPAPGEQGSTPFRSSTNRFRSSLVPMNKPSPARTARLTGKLATNPSYGRDLFRTSTPQTTRTTKFAPALPADATRTTPTARKFAQKTSQGGMSGIASAELFKMRIPSPDPELSGEALAKEVPNDPNRTGTIYADQFLAHKCPPHFDDLQRRQFFCILDLRRVASRRNLRSNLEAPQLAQVLLHSPLAKGHQAPASPLHPKEAGSRSITPLHLLVHSRQHRCSVTGLPRQPLRPRPPVCSLSASKPHPLPSNGAPSFSFTGATPLQNNSNMFAPKPLPGSSGSFLQASNDIPAGASSPFPAPSSLGTTPISGTPEPQSQGEDGEEGAQVQISLTATSEEDETVLHEVRAKAIKYIPIIKGSDDEEERKSPWSTQGVGTLRVLKHDHTGIVRVLLRAEPRGHVAMNKALLSDIEYKAKDKTVNFVAANDDGSGLETWVLQVKKPDMAQQLAGVLEQHKSANKK
ncbi:hypothetical protein M434DRAFT_159070 [Hypoxylon sp. CO27-5]|nr:hypothetical protein M434DRAFT_159070 [Hypoxylon sp. CO27-5]